MKKVFTRISTWLPLVIAISICVGLYLGSHFFGVYKRSDVSRKIETIMKYIDAEYVDDVDIDSLLEASIPDIISKLDPHSVYIPAKDLDAVNSELEGSFSGIGISFNMLTDTITVLEVIPGGPSEKVGILAGDRIISINDSIVDGKSWTNDKVIKHLRGEKGSTVHLGIKRASSPSTLYFDVVRDDIPVTSIDAAYIIEKNVGYIKVNKFGDTTFDEFFNSLIQLRHKGAEKYIVDLRGNTGGWMEMATYMANEFLPSGSPIVFTKGRIPSSISKSLANGTGAFQNEDLVVLIDEISASSSEIFAGAIQDNDRGLIIGRRSFGKGLVQRQIPLPDGSAVRLTRARYYTPSGRCIQKPYKLGSHQSYEMELSDRFSHGESFFEDSIHVDKSQQYFTANGRQVYGGGGIIPDVFVANDTTGISSYYINVFNAGLLQKFAFNFTDTHRESLNQSKTIDELLQIIPTDDVLLQIFVAYAKENGIAPRWYYINLSRDLIVSQLKALIARDILGLQAYYEVMNQTDTTMQQALKNLRNGDATAPIRISPKSANVEAPDSLSLTD